MFSVWNGGIGVDKTKLEHWRHPMGKRCDAEKDVKGTIIPENEMKGQNRTRLKTSIETSNSPARSARILFSMISA